MPDFGVYDSEDAATAQAGLFRSTVAWQLDPGCTVAGCSVAHAPAKKYLQHNIAAAPGKPPTRQSPGAPGASPGAPGASPATSIETPANAQEKSKNPGRDKEHRHSPKALQQSWRRATSTACKTLGTRAIAIRKLNLVAILKPTLLKAGPSPNSPVPARLSHGRGKGSAYSNSCFRPGLPSNRYRPTLPSHSVGPTLPSHSVGPTLPSYSVGPTLPSHSVGPTLPSYSVGYLWCMGRCQER
jgi:hypothetical protein